MASSGALLVNVVFSTLALGTLTAVGYRLRTKRSELSTAAERLRQDLERRALRHGSRAGASSDQAQQPSPDIQAGAAAGATALSSD
jgi:hypothetical protein